MGNFVQAKVGDRVRIINALDPFDLYHNGEIYAIVDNYPTGAMLPQIIDADGDKRSLLPWEYEIIQSQGR